jgi:hypothetical protein
MILPVKKEGTDIRALLLPCKMYAKCLSLTYIFMFFYHFLG